ncbi:hypothetical protein ONZ45_g14284 [Pleurotus djamor]|nr:hypothetical protein ONZ45_g14284 [Pleurotus djamor]
MHVTTTLPPITHFDRHLPPLTPPDEDMSSSSSSDASCSSSSRLPSIPSFAAPVPTSTTTTTTTTATTSNPFDEPYFVDWLDIARTRSAHFIAEKTCEMICYLWFASSPPASSSATSTSPTTATTASTSSPQHSYPSPNPSTSPILRNSKPTTSTLQLIATPAFVSFMQKMLETTQVSQSVIVLSLHYIHRLKERNRYTAGQPGSEFRIAVAGLMMANKFLDEYAFDLFFDRYICSPDSSSSNTYTNKTWSEVSGISLIEINKMEREFLLGVDFNLYVDERTYKNWTNLLKGLVAAKERDSRQWKKSRRGVAVERGRPSGVYGHANPPSTTGPTSRTRSFHHPRPRSTSPSHSSSLRSTSYTYPRSRPQPVATYAHTTHSYPQQQQLPSPPHYQPPHPQYPQPTSQYAHINDSPTHHKSGSKRTAEAAFSPTSATFSQVPWKRPIGISITTNTTPSGHYQGLHPHQGNNIGISTPGQSPLEGLQSFAKMSIAASGTATTVHSACNSPTPITPASATRSNAHSHSYPHAHTQTSSHPHSSSSTSSATPVKSTAQPGYISSSSPTTLSAAYDYDAEASTKGNGGVPKSLYYYSLSCSPMSRGFEDDGQRSGSDDEREDEIMEAEEESGGWRESKKTFAGTYEDGRKARLRCHQTTVSSTQHPHPPQPPHPAHASPSSAGSTSYYSYYYPSYSHSPFGHGRSVRGEPHGTSGIDSGRSVGYPSDVQSARTSPVYSVRGYHPQPHHQQQPLHSSSIPHSHLTSTTPAQPQLGAAEHQAVVLPHFNETVWAKPAYAATTTTPSSGYHQQQQPHQAQRPDRAYTHPQQHQPQERYSPSHSQPQPQQYSHSPSPSSSTPHRTHQKDVNINHHRNSIPSAPFNNAGPPGVVHFYPTPVQQQRVFTGSAAYSGGYGYGGYHQNQYGSAPSNGYAAQGR